MAAKTIDQCGYDGHRMIHFAETHGAEVRRGKGDHVVVATERGQCVIPDRELGHGLAAKIKKTLTIILVTLAISGCLWMQIIADGAK